MGLVFQVTIVGDSLTLEEVICANQCPDQRHTLIWVYRSKKLYSTHTYQLYHNEYSTTQKSCVNLHVYQTQVVAFTDSPLHKSCVMSLIAKQQHLSAYNSILHDSTYAPFSFFDPNLYQAKLVFPTLMYDQLYERSTHTI